MIAHMHCILCIHCLNIVQPTTKKDMGPVATLLLDGYIVCSQ